MKSILRNHKGMRAALTGVVLLLPVLLLSFSSNVDTYYQEETLSVQIMDVEITPEVFAEETNMILETPEPPLATISTLSGAYNPEQTTQMEEESANKSSEASPEEPSGASDDTPPVLPEPSKVAYLTFDDGPSRAVTPGILDVLQQEGILATFFVLPHPPRNVDDIYLRILEDGHEIANHSYSHNYSIMYRGEIEDFTEDVMQASEYILDKLDYTMTSFRFPGGPMGRPKSVIEQRREVLAELGYRDFAWDIDSGDSNPNTEDKSAEAIVSRVLENTRDREHLIILFHDSSSRETTLEALPEIIQGLRELGYRFDIIRNRPVPDS